ncbi:RNA recognition motif 2-domain-containing protein [Auriculariales sp. MPI-PUGE-AT-0066]|nr:RNA recognition motif 2-domain-containing protein [Auriculariales sp. MPI-PUGE-AT-0066]
MPASLNSQHVLRYEATPFVPSPTSPLYLSQVAAQTPTHLAPLSFVQRPHLTHIDTTTIESYYSAPSSITPLAVSPTDPGIFNSTDGIFKKSDRDNTIDLEKIEQGLDTRTTVMIKNVPNKMSDKNLLDFINDVCPRRIDFMYLRMDFVNNCNVGYAFVNFITVQDLVTFCRRRRGVKWNMYQSEKVLNMTYANYQGKEALVEKFKNSCIMDERESWRPKIFHSSGPAQGLPELFPDPTHLKRKERSQANARERILYANQTRHSHSRGHGAGRPAASRSPV